MKSGEYAGKNTIQRAKAQVELNLATAIKYNKKLHQPQRRVKDNLHL